MLQSLYKSKTALNRLAALVNLPQTEELTGSKIHKLLANQNTEASTLAVYCKNNNTHISGLVDTHFSLTFFPSTTLQPQTEIYQPLKQYLHHSLALLSTTDMKLMDAVSLVL